MFSKQTISSKIAIVALCALLVFLGNIKYRQWQKQQQIEEQILASQKQADALEKKNKQLSESLQYFNSSSFKERVAREQLGLKKEGEQVFSFADGTQVLGVSDSKPTGGNFKKWWDYFFAEN